MDYDVLILGGGIVGCAVAYELSKYNINIALIEKDYDVAKDISFANTAIIYDGSESDDNTMAMLENSGWKLIEKHCKKFNILHNRIGSLRIASSEEKLNMLNKKARNHGICGVNIVENNEIHDIEPNLQANINKALYSKNTAIISPYNLAVSYGEVAADNGVNFRLEEEVIDIKYISKGFKVTTNKNKFTCKFVVNTIPNESFCGKDYEFNNEIKNRKIKYILLNEGLRSCNNSINTIVIKEIDEKMFIMNIPILSNGNLVAIKNNEYLNLERELMLLKNVFKNIDKQLVTNIFTEVYDGNNILIDDSNIDLGYIKVTGNHYAKITIAPAIAKDIEEKLKINMNITKKRHYIDKRRDVYMFRNMSREHRKKIISLDNRYGNIICDCNNISEGEIVDCIRRPLGARTVEGVKRRTGIGIGGCNGSCCNIKIMKILAREMDKSILNVVDDSMNSNILVGRIKEFNEI